MDENTTKTSLWNKNVDDLTVGDAVKLNAAVLGGTLALGTAVILVATAVDKINTWKQARKEKKLSNVIDV
jgi:hypothetical protein